jgi:hypothetical protein
MTALSSRALCLLILLCTASPARGDGAAPGQPGVDLEIYGYIKLDAAYDDARTVVGDFVKWVELVPENPNDDAFSMTANQTRLGLVFEESSGKGENGDAGPQVAGRIEFDFYGGGAANRSRPMLRHAYLQMTWPASGFEILAGQTSDLISPRVPSTLNYSVAWWAGNIGYRRPQVRVTKSQAVSDDTTLSWSAALSRTIGSLDSDFASVDSGSDSGLPTVQARLGLEHGEATSLGLSGHFGEEELDLDAAGTALRFDSWSANIDFRSRITSKATLQGEGFAGLNLQSYLGGIGQGVQPTRLEEIASRGGWISLDLEPHGDWAYHLGASLDQVDEADLEPGDRSRNSSVFASAIRSWSPRTQFGVELSSWSTRYQQRGTAESTRAQCSFLYKF